MFCAPRSGVPRHVRLRGRVSILRSATRFAPARSQEKMVEDGRYADSASRPHVNLTNKRLEQP
jgi:hypothetical protein